MQLLEKDYNFPGLVVATTNLYEQLDNALFRRFDDAFEIPVPGVEEILKLLKFSLSTVKLSSDVDLVSTSNLLKGFSSADVVTLSQNAAKEAILHGESTVSKKLISQAISDFDRPVLK